MFGDDFFVFGEEMNDVVIAHYSNEFTVLEDATTSIVGYVHSLGCLM